MGPSLAGAVDTEDGFHGGRPSRHGLVERDGIWPILNIPVCWTKPLPQFQKDKDLVRQAIHDAIEKPNTGYMLTIDGKDWPVCAPGVRAEIEIDVEDQAPHTDIGIQFSTDPETHHRRAAPTHMTLNFYFKAAFKNCADNDSYRRNCIGVIAVHETMHALGVLHEQYNTNIEVTDPACYQRLASTFQADYKGTDIWPVTAHDPLSIMNYCRDIYRFPPKLSELDLRTLKALEGQTRAHL